MQEIAQHNLQIAEMNSEFDALPAGIREKAKQIVRSFADDNMTTCDALPTET